MKFLIISIFFIALISLISSQENTEEWQQFDMSQVIRIEDVPGFWDNINISNIYKNPAVNPRNRRIFGGVEVVPHSHPYQVALFIPISPTSTSICGGTVLNERAALTAAHCIDRVTSVTVVAGVHNIHQLEPTQQRRVVSSQNFRIHPGWGASTNNFFIDDVAIMILPTALTFNSFVTPVRLPFGFESETFVGELARVIGWGITSSGVSVSSVLRKAYNNIISNDECARMWNMSMTRILCTIETDQGACSSDSGGSLTVARPGDSRPVQVGIVAFGASTCGTPHAGGYARVTEYLDWIVANQSS